MNVFTARVLQVIDGDSLALAVDTGLDVVVSLVVSLQDVQVAGAGKQAGKAARDAAQQWLVKRAVSDAGTLVDVVLTRDNRESYGRFTGLVYAPGDAAVVAAGGEAQTLGRYLWEHGYAVGDD